jgi:amino acid adenylation domain-containing protein
MSDISKRIANLPPEKQQKLLQELLGRHKAGKAVAPRQQLVPRGSQEPAPLSFGQERMWFIDQLQPGSPAYNVPAIFPLGPVNPSLVELCLREIVRRHESLRTTFSVRDGRPIQVISPEVEVHLPVIDLSHLRAGENQEELQKRIAAELQRPFDLAKGPLMRTTMIRLAPSKDQQPFYVLVCVMHHIISDAWSLSVFFRELGALYEALGAGKPAKLPELPVQYADFALWQRAQLKDERLAELLSFWKEKLAGAPAALRLPTDRPRPSMPTSRGAVYSFVVPQPLHEQLKVIGERGQATQFMTYLAAFQVLLSWYAGTEDVVVGMPIANRSRAEFEGLIGFFLNTLVLRTRLSGSLSFVELLEQVRKETLAAYAHQDLPFEMLVEALKPERSLSLHPIFQVMFVMQSAESSQPAAHTEQVTPQLGAVQTGISRFDLTLSLMGRDRQTTAEIEYSTELFDERTIQRISEHYLTLLEGICHNPEERLSRLSILPPREQEELRRWNQTAADLRPVECVHQLLEQQAVERPDSVAVAFQGRTLTYRELNARANQIGHHLRGLGVGPESQVGIFIDRSIEMILGVFGILKAGGAYVPLDPTYPADRLEVMLADTGLSILLTQQHLVGRLPAYSGRVVCLDQEELFSPLPTQNVQSGVVPDNLAYIIYTSGSSGRPKGVMVPHRGVCNTAEVEFQLYQMRPSDRVLQFSSLNFDASMFELIMWLRGGATLQLASAAVIRSGVELARLIETEQVTVLPTPPSMLAMLPPGAFPSLRLILVMGEDCPVELVARWKHVPLFFNAYGPTETTMWSAGTFLSPDRPVTIGRPHANARIYILDAHLRQLPVGVPGELYIGGIGVTRGYLQRPELTAERFLPDLYSDEPGKRMYRTGDLAVYLPDGQIRFLGRTDHQVKIRGFRVELGEVESVLARHPRIKEAVVMIRDDLPSGRGLVGYFVPHQPPPPSTSELRRFILEKLPEYMVPSAFVVLDALPVSPAGKVDRKALPAPSAERPELDASFIAPTSEVEQAIAGIWTSVLGLERIGAHDNFFDLGGHSLLATRIVARMREAFHLDLSIRYLFEYPTIRALAEAVEEELRKEGRSAGVPPRPPAPKAQPTAALPPPAAEGPVPGDFDALLKEGVEELLALLSAEEKSALAQRLLHARAGKQRKHYPLAFAQERLWFLRLLRPEDVSYNVPFTFPLRNVEPALLRRALNGVIQRHEVLRTTFQLQSGRPVQVVEPRLELELPVEDLSRLDESTRGAEAQRIYERELRHRFDLTKGPLLRATLVRLGEDQCYLLLVMDHIITDGWSGKVFFQDLAALYGAAMTGAPAALPELQIQYGEYAQQQRERLQGEALERHLGYWRQKLSGIPARIELPLDRPRVAGADTSRGGKYFFELPEGLAKQMREVCQREQVTLFIAGLAAFHAFLWRMTRHESIVVGTPVTSRTHPGTEQLVGFFVNMLALRADFSRDLTFRQFLQQVRKTALEAYSHQDLPFERLVEELQPERDPTINPIFQVMFTLHVLEPASVNGVTSSQSTEESAGSAKFDLSLHLYDDTRGLKGDLEGRLALFDPSTLQRLAQRFMRFLEQLVADVDRPMVDFSLLTPGEGEALRRWNETVSPYPADRCLHELFADQAARTPDAVAAVFQDQSLTYAELDRRANRVAHHLRALGIREEHPVGVCLERSLELIVAVLGVLKAGGVYVPLDPENPDERLLLICADAKLPVSLTSEETAGRLSRAAARCVRVSECLEAGAGQAGAPRTAVGPDNAAYIIYTSGSTGTPKGAINDHRAVVNRLSWMQAAYGLTSRDSVLQKTSIGFDVSVWDLLWPVLVGARLVLAEPGKHRDASYLVSAIERYQVTHLHFVPSMLRAFLEEPGVSRLTSLRRVICSGEELTAGLQQAFFDRLGSCELHNLYGPTEAAIDVTAWKCRREQARPSVPIGHPISNTRIYVLDDQLRELPVGMTGEIYIGGIAPARGYLGRPALTAERFLPDPHSPRPSARMYRTGDLGQRLPGGEIEYLGRIDHQVKIRGVRIELGEIEAALLQQPGVREAVVMVDAPQEDSGSPGDKRLVAYYVRHPESEVDSEALRGGLQQKLPPSMVPSVYVELPVLPLTSSGKLDRKALPRPQMTRARLKNEFVAPRNPMEALISMLWTDVLGVERVGAEDNFFFLGGHSLSAVRVLSRLRETLGVEVAVASFFDAPTPALLAQHLLRAASARGELEARAAAVMQVLNLSDAEVEAQLRGQQSQDGGGSRA